MDPEEHFLEVATKAHKGARSAEMKTKLLPIVAPAFGVDNKNWAVVFWKFEENAICLCLWMDMGL